MDLARTSIAQIHPGMPVFEMSAKTEAGFDGWIAWIEAAVDAKKKA
jgi:hydrogenase nickel incorporation protein HypB